MFSKDKDVQAIGRIARKLDRSSHMSKREKAEKKQFKSISPVNIDSTGMLSEIMGAPSQIIGLI